jgi:hypothetical protein
MSGEHHRFFHISNFFVWNLNVGINLSARVITEARALRYIRGEGSKMGEPKVMNDKEKVAKEA